MKIESDILVNNYLDINLFERGNNYLENTIPEASKIKNEKSKCKNISTAQLFQNRVVFSRISLRFTVINCFK